ncbi:MAG TPA: NAD(P) transhydrogenase subunit alpha [Acidimicrobiales bacterium]|nr:NAD(P) transhydrogenase subunit alpha [Acidimicrobiales bacterium]
MKVGTVGVLAEDRDKDRRVALVPDGVRRLARSGLAVLVETGAGAQARYRDSAYEAAGAAVAGREEVLEKSDVLLSVGRPPQADLDRLRAGQALVGMLDPQSDPEGFERLSARGVIAVSMERLPRTLSRAQTMDVLTSQAGVAGYRAALVAAETYDRYLPMLITAAGTSRPARVLVLGAGVAGLSAIATARRLGAVVTGYDVRPEAKGEVESLGGRWLELSSIASGAGEGGYARALTEEEQKAQQAELESLLTGFDIVITTAAVPGRRPPLLISADGVGNMANGSVIVDLAAGPLGGNVEGTVDGSSIETPNGTTIVGLGDAASQVPGAASDALSANYLAVITTLAKDGELTIDPADPVHAAIVVAAPKNTGETDARLTSL